MFSFSIKLWINLHLPGQKGGFADCLNTFFCKYELKFQHIHKIEIKQIRGENGCGWNRSYMKDAKKKLNLHICVP